MQVQNKDMFSRFRRFDPQVQPIRVPLFDTLLRPVFYLGYYEKNRYITKVSKQSTLDHLAGASSFDFVLEHDRRNIMPQNGRQLFPGGGDTPLYKLYGYVQRQSLWFLGLCGLKMGPNFNDFGLKV